MYVIGDIGNTETKIFVYSTQKKIIKKIILKSNSINNQYLKKNLSYILKKKIYFFPTLNVILIRRLIILQFLQKKKEK